MRLEDFYYDLPQELIAQKPLPVRSKSRLLVLDRKTGEISHKIFYEIKDMLNKGDCLVLNNTRVIPARLLGEKEGTGSPIELVLLKKLEADKWEVLTKPGKRAKTGAKFIFGGGLLKAEITGICEGGNRIAKFSFDGDSFESVLDKVGIVPLPPYIKEKLDDPERYQTVYSKIDGSAAAPTAGLHFTEGLLDSLKEKGILMAFITLHVGLGTFRPVKVQEIERHKMHAEYFSIDSSSCEAINRARQEGGRVVAAGTTSLRALESVSDDNGNIKPKSGWTDIFIRPGYRFKIVDALVTNFHLPESTLIMLVSAFAGLGNTMAAYKAAVDLKYRFFSFGDAMFIK